MYVHDVIIGIGFLKKRRRGDTAAARDRDNFVFVQIAGWAEGFVHEILK